MTGRVVMVQGTMSSVGKSLLVAALCRIFRRRGVRVAPFKAQNMSNNAGVTPGGGEIGRSTMLQAEACGIAPTVEMNPVLLKPEADARSQVVVLGRSIGSYRAGDYYRHKAHLWPVVTAALDRLRDAYELVVIEGAGSAAEINLKAGDIVNMAVARHAQAPVLLVGDIDRGGIFAQLLGTLGLLEPEERALVRGLLVNKFRGDPALFTDGVRMIEERGSVPVLGVIPYIRDVRLPEEDAVALDAASDSDAAAQVDIAVIHLPHISNFDDFDPLAAEAGVRMRYIRDVADVGRPDAIILPGTKSTLDDLHRLCRSGLAAAIIRHAQGGGAVVGICGGYQMLGGALADPHGVEGAAGRIAYGLGLLDVETSFAADKVTQQAQARIVGAGWLADLAGQRVTGYEIHMGRTTGGTPWLRMERPDDEAVAVLDGDCVNGGRVWGCYLHGIFANEDFRRAWLRSLGWQATGVVAVPPLHQALDALADAVEAALDMARLERIVWGD